MPPPFVAISTTSAGCMCSDSQRLDAINQNLAQGFEALINDSALGAATFVDGSGTITAGGTSQQIFAANADRSYLIVINNSDTDMWIDFAVAAVAAQPSIRLVPNGGFYEPLVAPNQTVNIFCATTGKAFTAKQA